MGIVAGVVLLGLLIGYLTGELPLVLTILKALVLVLTGITILVTIHELGHFLTAKAFGMRVETFSIGFPPKIISFTRGDTEYQVGATPLGGYVKISGIIDESLDTKHLNSTPEPYEFRAKPVWQRLIVMTGGVIMNVILGIIIFTSLKMAYPEFRLPMSEVKYGIDVAPGGKSLGSFIGFQTGDEIVSFKGRTFPYFDDYASHELLLEDDAYYVIRRAGVLDTLFIRPDIQNFFNNDTISGELFAFDSPALIRVSDSIDLTVGDQTLRIALPAHAAGVRTGDRILSLDSVAIDRFSDVRTYMQGKANQTIETRVLRGSDTLSFAVQVDSLSILGVAPDTEHIFRVDTIHYSFFGDPGFFDALRDGTAQAFGFVSTNIQGIRNLGREGVDARKSVMGPIQIAKVYLNVFNAGGIRRFFELTGMLSMILAFVNILPIPALDGGHVLFLLIEAITRREPSPRVRIIAQQVGMILILGLMLLIFFNDALTVLG
ncbi:MAG: RIP metalloprotease RseP [Bacteroidia bacterium]